jgi:hypothetical protein
MQWAFETTYHLYEQGYIEHAQLLSALNTELRNYRDKLKKLVNYDWVPVPLGRSGTMEFE